MDSATPTNVHVRLRQWLSRLLTSALFIIVAAFLIYWSWCWGLWGQNNLWMQYLFNCHSPEGSEATRYPDQIDLLVSGCASKQAKESKANELTQAQVTIALSSEWWVLTDAQHSQFTLLDVRDGYQLVLPVVHLSKDDNLSPDLWYRLRRVSRVYTYGFALLFALGQEAGRPGDESFVIVSQDFDQTHSLSLVGYLEAAQIPVSAFGFGAHLSPNHRFWSFVGFIRSVATDEAVADSGSLGDRFSTPGWVADGRGIILLGEDVYVIGGPGSIDVLTPSWFPVPQPLLLLKLPDQYLTAEQRQADEADLAGRHAARAQALVVVALGLAVEAGLVVLWRSKRQPRGTKPG